MLSCFKHCLERSPQPRNGVWGEGDSSRGAKGKKNRHRAQHPPHKAAVDGHFLRENMSVVFFP